MAVVDFSNAHIEATSINNTKPMTIGYLGLRGYRGDPRVCDSSGSSIVSNLQQTDGTVTINSTYVTLSGTFTASGTELYVGNTVNGLLWKISNVSFSSGDTFDFRIDAEITIV